MSRPANILVSNLQTLDIKLADFGKATFVADNCHASLCTPGYRPPETIPGGFPLDHTGGYLERRLHCF